MDAFRIISVMLRGVPALSWPRIRRPVTAHTQTNRSSDWRQTKWVHSMIPQACLTLGRALLVLASASGWAVSAHLRTYCSSDWLHIWRMHSFGGSPNMISLWSCITNFSVLFIYTFLSHHDTNTWKHFPQYWFYVWGTNKGSFLHCFYDAFNIIWTSL